MKLTWNALYYNANAKKIETYNVVGGKYFLEKIKKIMKKHRDKSDFAEALKREMMCRFWSRAEWELVIEITEDGRVLLSPWVGCSNPDEVRIDVTNNADFDWRGFAKLHIGKQMYKNKAKIDVYDQLEYVWDEFIDCVWSSKQYRKPKEVTVND